MRKLYSYINDEFYSIFTPSLFGLTIMILALRLVKIFESLQASLSTIDILNIIALLLPSIYIIILPIAYLIAITVTLTKLSSTNELIALNNSGISLQRILKVLLIITLPILIFNFLNTVFIKPSSNKLLREILHIKLQNIVTSPQKNIFTKLSKGKYVFIEEKEGGLNSIIYTSFKDNNFITVSAVDGNIDKGIVNFKSGNLILTKEDKTEILDFENLSLPIIEDSEKKDVELKRGSIPFIELLKIYKEGSNHQLIKTELFYRIFYSIAPLILLILSFPLSIGFSRHYKTQGVLISIFTGLLFYILFSFADTLSIKGKLDPLYGFLSIYFFLALLSFAIFHKKGLISKRK